LRLLQYRKWEVKTWALLAHHLSFKTWNWNRESYRYYYYWIWILEGFLWGLKGLFCKEERVERSGTLVFVGSF
jgi:hypothetical protein